MEELELKPTQPPTVVGLGLGLGLSLAKINQLQKIVKVHETVVLLDLKVWVDIRE